METIGSSLGTQETERERQRQRQRERSPNISFVDSLTSFHKAHILKVPLPPISATGWQLNF
jgi:hypothetical protein